MTGKRVIMKTITYKWLFYLFIFLVLFAHWALQVHHLCLFA